MNAVRKKDRVAIQVEKVLKEHFLPRHPDAQIEVYRYCSTSVWVRIIDSIFAGKRIPERIDLVWDIIRKHVPKKIISMMIILVLIPPEERDTDGLNYEFEHPTPSRL